MKKYETEFEVVGMTHHLSMENRQQLKRSLPTKLLIEREPDNPVDDNALVVRVGSSEVKIGYLRRGVAKVLAPEIDKGKLRIVKARLVELSTSRGEGTAEVWLEKGKN